MSDWIVELEPGVYLADGDGDPPRTLVKEYARVFPSNYEACIARMKAREMRPFKAARVTLADVTPNAEVTGRPNEKL